MAASVDKELAASLLPRGFRLGAELREAGLFGHLFEVIDERLGADYPVARIVRFLELPKTWSSRFLSRAHRLGQMSIGHVARPIGFGFDDPTNLAYLIYDRFSFTLSSRIAATALPESVSWQLFSQLVNGVAELHLRGIAHGEIRPRNVFVDSEEPNEESSATLMDTEIGPVAHWSGGELLEQDARTYFPPEWQDRFMEPSPLADVYALGLLGCQIFLGLGAHVDAQDDGGRRENLHERLDDMLRKQRLSRHRRRVLVRMIDPDPSTRPTDAAVVRKMLRPSERLAKVVILAGILVMLFLTVLGWRGKANLRRRLTASQTTLAREGASKDKLQAELAKTSADLRITIQERDEFKTRSDDVSGRLSSISSIVRRESSDAPKMEAIAEVLGMTPAAPSHEEIAREAWALYFGLSKDQLAAFEQLIRDAGRLTSDQTTAEIHGRWIKDLRTPYTTGLPWLRYGDDDRNVGRLRDALDAAILEPWDPSTLEQANNVATALANATGLWAQYARTKSMDWDAFRNSLVVAAGAEDNKVVEDVMRQILNAWITDFNDRRSKRWQLVVHSGKIEKDAETWGVSRILRIGVAGKEVSYKHEWSRPGSHEYSKTCNISWTPGRPIEIVLFYDRLGPKNEVLCSGEFSGPVALWLANNTGKVTDPETGASVDFAILECPGPPRAVYSALSKAFAELPTAKGH